MRTEINDLVQTYVTYEHDDLNRIIGVFDHDLAQVPANPDTWFKDATVTPTEFDYNPLGQMTNISRPNDVTTTYSYGDVDVLVEGSRYQNPYQVYSILHEDTETTPVTLAQYDYNYDAVGNRIGMDITASDGSQTNITYDYDRASRMVEESYALIGGATSETTYQYDRAGNRTQMRQGDDITRYTYNANDELTRIDMPDYYFEDYTYDSRGNLTLVEAGGHGTYSATNYAYNARDQLISAIVPGSGTVTYDYDYLGNRVEQIAGATTTNYLWDELSRYGDVILETDPNNPLDIVSYTVTNGMLISQNSAGNVDYFLQDAQGSTVGIADETGTVTSSYSYNAFGELDDSSTLETNYLYTGQQFDSETELYSLRARYYSPSNGRFVSRDKLAYNYENPIELNRYGYTANNPATYTDPSGYGIGARAALGAFITTVGAVSLPSVAVMSEAALWAAVIGLLLARPHIGAPPEVTEKEDRTPSAPAIPDHYPLDITGDNIQALRNPDPDNDWNPFLGNVLKLLPLAAIPAACLIFCPRPRDDDDDEPQEHLVLGFTHWGPGQQKGQEIFMPMWFALIPLYGDHARISPVREWGRFTLTQTQSEAGPADRIHFNLEEIRDGRDPLGYGFNEFADNFGNNGIYRRMAGAEPDFYHTAWELWNIRDKYCNKTYFYEQGSTNQTPSLDAGKEICGDNYRIPSGHPLSS